MSNSATSFLACAIKLLTSLAPVLCTKKVELETVVAEDPSNKQTCSCKCSRNKHELAVDQKEGHHLGCNMKMEGYGTWGWGVVAGTPGITVEPSGDVGSLMKCL